jgi:sugar O-acyltransferase (sialic acid O-acetyltransferase NeuD family)
MSKLMILGAGGHGKVVVEIAELMKKWDEIVFLDDNKELKEVNGFKVIGGLRDYQLYIDHYDSAFVAIGNNKFRIELIDELKKYGFRIPVLIHPFTAISKNVELETGSVVMAGAVINTNTYIDEGCIINTSSSIDHDCILGKGVHISPGTHIGGTTHIGENTWICIGSSVANNINIGNNTIVASGATVIDDIKDLILVGGVPAKFIKNLK